MKNAATLNIKADLFLSLANAAPILNINSLPGFKPLLFREAPNTIWYLNALANIVNGFMLKESANRVSFDVVFKAPSISPSEFSNDLKHLIEFAKWLYSVFTSNKVSYYTIQGLTEFINNLITTIRQKSFVDTTIPTSIINLGQTILTSLNP